MEMRPYEPIEGGARDEIPLADMCALNAPGAEDAIAVEAELTRAQGKKLDAYVGALAEHTAAMREQGESVDRLAEECTRGRALAEESAATAAEALADTRAELVRIYEDVSDRALVAGERAARRCLYQVEQTIREHHAAVANDTDEAVAAVREAGRRAAADVDAATAKARAAIAASQVDSKKVMDDMRRQYSMRLLVVPATVVVMGIVLALLLWRAWPLVSGQTMTDLDSANLRIEQLSAELDAYKSTGVTLGDERQNALDERLRELQDAYDEAHGAPQPAE